MIIKIIKASENCLHSVVDIINDATLNLNKKGINQWNYPCDAKEIEHDIMKNYVYILVLNDNVVGTFSLRPIEHYAPLDVEPNSKYLYRLAILSAYKGNNLGKEMIEYVCRTARCLGSTIYLDCWAGNKKLRKFYTEAGFEFLGDFPEEDYFISVFKYK